MKVVAGDCRFLSEGESTFGESLAAGFRTEQEQSPSSLNHKSRTQLGLPQEAVVVEI